MTKKTKSRIIAALALTTALSAPALIMPLVTAPPALAGEATHDFADLAAKVTPAVVNVAVTMKADAGDDEIRMSGKAPRTGVNVDEAVALGAAVQAALADASNAPGYPLTQGTPEFSQALSHWLHGEARVSADAGVSVLPTIGLKEVVASLPTLLGLGARDAVVVPQLAYPTYEVGAIAAARASSTGAGRLMV